MTLSEATLNRQVISSPIYGNKRGQHSGGITKKRLFFERLQRSHEEFLRGEYQDLDVVMAELRQKYEV